MKKTPLRFIGVIKAVTSIRFLFGVWVVLTLFLWGQGASWHAWAGLGMSKLFVIAHPDRVEAYRVDMRATSTFHIGRFPITAVSHQHNPATDTFISRAVLDAFNENFGDDLDCDTRPGVIFRFIKGGRTVDALVCFHCGELELHDSTESSAEPLHFEPIQGELLKAAQASFPNDADLKKLDR